MSSEEEPRRGRRFMAENGEGLAESSAVGGGFRGAGRSGVALAERKVAAEDGPGVGVAEVGGDGFEDRGIGVRACAVGEDECVR